MGSEIARNSAPASGDTAGAVSGNREQVIPRPAMLDCPAKRKRSNGMFGSGRIYSRFSF